MTQSMRLIARAISLNFAADAYLLDFSPKLP
jgi:hypothetical protein